MASLGSIVSAVAHVARQILSPRHGGVNERPHRRRLLRAVYGSVVGVVLVVGLVLGLRAVIASAFPLTSRFRTIKTNDQGLRQRALSAPTPIYPSPSMAKNVTGVVVAAVTIHLNGQVRSVSILESPDAATGRAVRDAVNRWSFRPVTGEVPDRFATENLVVAGNLVFYFHIKAGQGVVSSPEELKQNTGGFSRLRTGLTPIVLDIRSRAAYRRDGRDGAVNIPLPELSARAVAELPRTRLIVIECFAEQQDSGRCEMAVRVLSSAGFSQVAILKRPTR